MKPVCRGVSRKRYSTYVEAKPELIRRLGQHCSYCEAYRVPTAIDVEHIYPKKAHPRLENSWDNFLLACESCNSKKNKYLGSGRQRALHRRYLWPHIDNTARAFRYYSDGRVSPAPNLPALVQKLAAKTIEMVGFMSSPANAKKYDQLSVSYTGASLRKDAWDQAASIRVDYLLNPTPVRAFHLAGYAVKIGYFSVWMEVFHDRPEFRLQLVAAFKADRKCFGKKTRTVRKGRV